MSRTDNICLRYLVTSKLLKLPTTFTGHLFLSFFLLSSHFINFFSFIGQFIWFVLFTELCLFIKFFLCLCSPKFGGNGREVPLIIEKNNYELFDIFHKFSLFICLNELNITNFRLSFLSHFQIISFFALILITITNLTQWISLLCANFIKVVSSRLQRCYFHKKRRKIFV